MIFNSNLDTYTYYDSLRKCGKKEFIRNIFDCRIIRDEQYTLYEYFIFVLDDPHTIYFNINYSELCRKMKNDRAISKLICGLVKHSKFAKIKEICGFMMEIPFYKNKLISILHDSLDTICGYYMFRKLACPVRCLYFAEKLFGIFEFLLNGSFSYKFDDKFNACQIMMICAICSGNQRKIDLYTKKLRRYGFEWKYVEHKDDSNRINSNDIHFPTIKLIRI